MKYYIKLNTSKLLLILALGIVSTTMLYINSLANKLKVEEQKKVALWAQATKLLSNINDSDQDVGFILDVVSNNTTVPVIQTNYKGDIIGYRNITNPTESTLNVELQKMKQNYPPIVIELIDGNNDFIYYKDSDLLQRLQLFPIIMFLIIAAFMTMAYYAFSKDRLAKQNKVWTGLAKETAHQIGTPLSSLMGWLEYLKKENNNSKVAIELEKDISRLNVIASRFSKIGSIPKLKVQKLYPIINNCIEYMKQRVSQNINFKIIAQDIHTTAYLNKDLFEWVIENIIKNSVDAIEKKGEIFIKISEIKTQILIDIVDNGKGMETKVFKKIFDPGYTSKKRGWGLGLSLVRRIIEDYHNGQVTVLSSIPNKKTTLRISINK